MKKRTQIGTHVCTSCHERKYNTTLSMSWKRMDHVKSSLFGLMFNHRLISGPKHRQRFLCEVRVPGHNYVGAGNSSNKKDAQFNAAKDFVQYLVRQGVVSGDEVPQDVSYTLSSSSSLTTVNSIVYFMRLLFNSRWQLQSSQTVPVGAMMAKLLGVRAFSGRFSSLDRILTTWEPLTLRSNAKVLIVPRPT